MEGPGGADGADGADGPCLGEAGENEAAVGYDAFGRELRREAVVVATEEDREGEGVPMAVDGDDASGGAKVEANGGEEKSEEKADATD